MAEGVQVAYELPKASDEPDQEEEEDDDGQSLEELMKQMKGL